MSSGEEGLDVSVESTSEHAEALGVGDGLEETLLQLVLVAIVGEQQDIEACVGRWQPEQKHKYTVTLALHPKSILEL